MEFIDIKKQYQLYKKEIDKEIHEVLDSGHFIMGDKVNEVEHRLAEFVGVDHCISVSSGTDSLVVPLLALGIGAGDEVITTPFTFIASAEVIKFVGATPVFIDIDPETYNLDVDQIESAITEKTKAIIGVSLFGQMPDYERINQIADKHGLVVIEDGAQSLGATQNGKSSCSVTKVGTTSFFPAKPLGCYGDGGAIFTDDDELASKMRKIRVHGAEKRFEHVMSGMNARFDTLQAAVLLAKLPHFSSEIEKRQEIGARYSKLLEDFCVVPKILAGNTHVYAQYTIRIANRDLLAEELKKKGIPTGVYYPKCVHEQPSFKGLGYQAGDFPVAETASREVISLPMHPWLTEEEQDEIVGEITAFVKNQAVVPSYA